MVKAPQSLPYLKPRDTGGLRIQNFSSFRKLIKYIHYKLCCTQSGVWTLPNNQKCMNIYTKWGKDLFCQISSDGVRCYHKRKYGNNLHFPEFWGVQIVGMDPRTRDALPRPGRGYTLVNVAEDVAQRRTLRMITMWWVQLLAFSSSRPAFASDGPPQWSLHLHTTTQMQRNHCDTWKYSRT